MEKRVGELWTYYEYLGGVQVLVYDVGPKKVAKCIYSKSGRCEKWDFDAVPKICGLCGSYEEK